MSVNKRRFISSISFVRISYKIIWLKTWSWYKNPLKNASWKGLKIVSSRRCASKIWMGVSEVRFKKNSTPSPWKYRKTTTSALFCATGAWGLKPFELTCPIRQRGRWNFHCSSIINISDPLKYADTVVCWTSEGIGIRFSIMMCEFRLKTLTEFGSPINFSSSGNLASHRLSEFSITLSSKTNINVSMIF